MNKKRERIVWNIKDIMSSSRVQEMNLEQEGAYRRALDRFYLDGFLPSDTTELAKRMGKNCTIETAEVVKKMFIPKSGFPNVLSHDYLGKMQDGDEQELVYASSDESKKELLIKTMKLIDEDESIVTFVKERHGLSRAECRNVVNDFLNEKLAVNGYKSYRNADDVRKNFIYHLPYTQIVKEKNTHGKQSFAEANGLNSKSVTSKLFEAWQSRR